MVVDGLLFQDDLELLANVRDTDVAKIEALTAGLDGGQDLVGFGGGKDEFDVAGRFLQDLEQRVEGSDRQHVHFIDDVDLVAAAGGPIDGVVPQLSDLVHAVVAGAVDLQDVDVVPGVHGQAAFTAAAGFSRGRLTGMAVQRLGQNAGDRGLTHAPGAGEQIGVGDSARLDSILQRMGDGILPDDIIKGLGSVFSC